MGDESESRVVRFRRLEHLYHSALALTAAERTAFLEQACVDDDTLRHEVETLLAAQPQAADFLSVPIIEREARRRAEQLGNQALNDNQPITSPAALNGQAINQYKIVTQLGKGGMGEVWLAEDSRLKRKVALKLLSAEFTNDAGRVRRFEQEAHAVSALNHPNIITLFDFGQTENGYFITTEFVDGQALRARLNERMLVSDAIEIALQICAALVTAHEAGIIHRDIKPENVMLRKDGIVKVLDFGLAKLTERKSAGAKERLGEDDPTLALPPSDAAVQTTEAGTVMGTASYMSPEQARGLRVDARTDIFSLGVVLYEMLAGKRPFDGVNMLDVIGAILNQEPAPLANQPSELQRIVTKALAKDREARYQTIGALTDDLKQYAETLQFQTRLARSGESDPSANTSLPAVAAPSSAVLRKLSTPRNKLFGLLALVTLLLAILAWRLLQPNAATLTANAPIKTIAVLPFRFLGSERTEEYLSLGMTESLITKLSSTRQLTVRPTSAVLKYQNTNVEPDRATRELQTDAVIEGSVQKIGDKLRVTVQLIRAGVAQPLWAGDFNESVNDLFTLQDKLAARVTQELTLQLTGAERQQLAKRTTANPEAYRLYLQGRYFHNKRTAEGLQQARSFYERAIALDPKFAAAYAELALSWANLAERGSVPSAEGAQQALALAAKAVELDDTLAEAHANLGFMKLSFVWDLPGAEIELQRALELDPQQMETRQWHGVYLLARGRAEEAIAETRRAVELDPTSLQTRAQLGRALYLGRHYDEVITTCQELLQMEENHTQAYVWLGQAYSQQGNHTAAIAALEKASRLDAGKLEAKAALGHAYAVAGKVEEARMILADLQGRSDFPGQHYHLATMYAALGDRVAALAQLEEAYQRHDPGLILRGKLDPKLNPLRNDPGFTALLQRIGLTPAQAQ